MHRILIAEDEISAAEAVSRTLLARVDCTVDVTYNGDEALAALADQAYDLFITDMQMPGCHGIDLVARVVEQWPDTDIVVTTAFPHEFPYVKLIDAGAADFITKPYSMDELEAKVLRLFRERERRGTGGQGEDGRYRGLFEFNVDGMLILELDGYRIKDVNRAFCNVTGCERTELAGKSLFELFEHESRVRLESAFDLFATTGQGALGDIWVNRGDGKRVCLDVSVTFVKLSDDHFVQVSCKDVSEQFLLQQELADFAQKDSLTGLLNKRMLRTHVEGAIAQAHHSGDNASLLFIDLDNFKQCNDTHGHETGDEMLKSVGALIRSHVRVGSDEGFRYGGDEFAVLLLGADSRVGQSVGERIRVDFLSGETFGTSMSIGVAQLKEGMDAEGFIRAADAAVYAAKTAGKNRVSVA